MGNRILKESVRRSPQIDALSWFEEVVYYRLLTVADDFGRMDGRIVVLTHDLFPTKDNVSKAQVARAVKNMISLGLLAEYQVDGQPYLYFPTWAKHQSLRHAKAKCPPPPSAAESGSTNTTSRRNLPQRVVHGDPQSAAESGSSNTTVCRELRQEVVHEEPQLAAKCGSTRAGAESESESEIESESETPPAVVVESETREAPAPAADLPEDNPFGDRDGQRPSFDTLEAYASSNLAALTPRHMEELAAFRAELPEELIRHAIDEAAGNGHRVWNYVRAILTRYREAGYKTVGEVQAAEEARRASMPSSKPAPERGYQQHEYKPEDFGEGFYYDPSRDYPAEGTGT